MTKRKKIAPPAPPAPPAPVDPLELQRAQGILARHAQEQADARRSKLLDQLRAVRAELRTARPAFAVIAAKVMGLRADGENLSRAISTRQERISELHASKPACADYLPSDPDVVEWRAALAATEVEIEHLRSVAESLPNLYQLQLQGVELQQRISSLEYGETNLLNALSGVSGKAWGGKLAIGGVSGVF
ncbi:MAG: hypothetical protein ACLQLH_12925 [Terracidiphilus sp.]